MSREEGGWRVSVRKGRSKRRFDFSRYEGFSYRKDGKYAFHWERSGLSRTQADFYLALARSDGYEAQAVEAAFERSSDYRKGFLESDPGPWRCRYCHRRLSDASEMTVDHVVPVGAVKDAFPPRRALARRLLSLEGAATVNDPANLAPACPKCNSRKGQKVGLWPLRAVLGAKAWYWPALRALQAGAVAFAVWFALAGPAATFTARFLSGLLKSAAYWM